MRRRWLILLALLAACSSGTAKPAAECRASAIISEGESIPLGCSFDRLDGGTIALSELKGKPAVLNFWASWCPNCIEEMPALEQAHKRYGDRVRFIGVDLLGIDGETTGDAKRFAQRTRVTYEIIEDQGGLLASHFTVRLLPPMTIFVDANGVVRFRKFGQLDSKDISDFLGTYLDVR